MITKYIYINTFSNTLAKLSSTLVWGKKCFPLVLKQNPKNKSKYANVFINSVIIQIQLFAMVKMNEYLRKKNRYYAKK